MNRLLNPEELFELSKSFHELSVIVGNYKYAHWKDLSAKQRSDLEDLQWTLFNTASDLNARSLFIKVKLTEQDISVLKAASSSMQTATEKIQNIKHIINISAKAIAFGGALYAAASTGNISVIIPVASALIKEIDT